MNDSPVTTDTKPHHCQHPGCTKWGGFGFDRVERSVKKTDWWCWEHYPYKEPPASKRPQ